MAKQTALNALIDTYYKTLGELAQQYATHEGAVSVAFQSLLAATARRHHWTLIPQLSAKGIRPDATLKDPMGLVRGHWEAKDTDDNLDVEIAKKIQKGYPLGNIIFEDTRAAILIQNKTEVMRVDLRDRQQVRGCSTRSSPTSNLRSRPLRRPSMSSRSACPTSLST